jgi:hypothetical protein
MLGRRGMGEDGALGLGFKEFMSCHHTAASSSPCKMCELHYSLKMCGMVSLHINSSDFPPHTHHTT